MGLICVNLSSVKGACSERDGGLPSPDALADGFEKPGSSFPEQKSLLQHSTFLLSLENLDSVIGACYVACEVCNAMVCSFTTKVA